MQPCCRTRHSCIRPFWPRYGGRAGRRNNKLGRVRCDEGEGGGCPLRVVDVEELRAVTWHYLDAL